MTSCLTLFVQNQMNQHGARLDSVTAWLMRFPNNTLHNEARLIAQIEGAGYIIGFVKTSQ